MFTKEIMDTFTDLDLAVYDCIVKNRGRISRMPIKELAAMAHVSTHLEGKRDALKDDGTAELQSFVNQVRSEDFQESIEAAFQYLRKSRCTIFVGVGSSGMLGRYGARYFSNVGRFSLFIDDPWLPVLQDLSEDTVTIALSESGLTSQTITIASQLQERGSRLISITNNANSVLARMADCNISYHVAEALVNERNVTTQIPVIYIIEMLAKKLYNSDNP